MEEQRIVLSKAEGGAYARMQQGKRKVVYLQNVLVGSEPEERLRERMVGAVAGCRGWRETHWEKSMEDTMSWIPESSSSIANVTSCPAGTSGVRHHAFPGVMMMIPGGGWGPQWYEGSDWKLCVGGGPGRTLQTFLC